MKVDIKYVETTNSTSLMDSYFMMMKMGNLQHNFNFKQK